MLAYNGDWDVEDLKPGGYLVTPKLDGMRAYSRPDGYLWSRTFRKVKNRFIQEKFREIAKQGQFDGELIIPGYTAAQISGVCRSESDERGQNAQWILFDAIIHNSPAYSRIHELHFTQTFNSSIQIVPYAHCDQRLDFNPLMLDAFVTSLGLPIEGYMIRRAGSFYKQGRATLKESTLFKLTRFSTDYAEFIRFAERWENDEPLGEAGSIIARWKGQHIIRIGTGFSRTLAKEWWETRHQLRGRVKFKYKQCGMQLLPRQPVFLEFV